MSENNNVPVTILDSIKDFTKDLAGYEKGLNDFVMRLQSYQRLANKPVEAEKLEEHPFVRGANYLPISFMEMTLDELYFGLWQTKNFSYSQVSNEILASIELSVYHPIAKTWITRTGVSAVQIMVDSFPEKPPAKNIEFYQDKIQKYNKAKNEWSLDPANKKPAALTNGIFAALKAECFKNACISLGTYFGRDVNRKKKDSYTPLFNDLDDQITTLKVKLSDLVSLVQDDEEMSKIVNEIREAEDKGEATIKFYKKQISKLERND